MPNTSARPRQAKPVTIGTKRRPPKNARYSGIRMSLYRLYSRPAMIPDSSPIGTLILDPSLAVKLITARSRAAPVRSPSTAGGTAISASAPLTATK